ncbi:unnamed protein product, partial [Lymnaea stagnalis]
QTDEQSQSKTHISIENQMQMVMTENIIEVSSTNNLLENHAKASPSATCNINKSSELSVEHLLSATRGYKDIGDDDAELTFTVNQQHFCIHLLYDPNSIPTVTYTTDSTRVSPFLNAEERPAIFTKKIALLAKVKKITHNVFTEAITRFAPPVVVATVDMTSIQYQPDLVRIFSATYSTETLAQQFSQSTFIQSDDIPCVSKKPRDDFEWEMKSRATHLAAYENIEPQQHENVVPNREIELKIEAGGQEETTLDP